MEIKEALKALADGEEIYIAGYCEIITKCTDRQFHYGYFSITDCRGDYFSEEDFEGEKYGFGYEPDEAIKDWKNKYGEPKKGWE